LPQGLPTSHPIGRQKKGPGFLSRAFCVGTGRRNATELLTAKAGGRLNVADKDTESATITYVKLKEKYYALTCAHVADAREGGREDGAFLVPTAKQSVLTVDNIALLIPCVRPITAGYKRHIEIRKCCLAAIENSSAEASAYLSQPDKV
jgi:hypothetical protein